MGHELASLQLIPALGGGAGKLHARPRLRQGSARLLQSGARLHELLIELRCFDLCQQLSGADSVADVPQTPA
jgi:hypothetical protein